MRVLITGATGFLGPDVVNVLLENKFRVRCLVRDKNKAEKYFGNGVEYFIGDITDPDSLRNITKDIDYVIHLAVLGHSGEMNLTLNHYRSVNVEGTNNLLKQIQLNPVKKIICFSSSAAVGLVNSKVISEETICNPQTPYGISKYETDKLIKHYFDKWKLPIVTIRFTHIYGPGDIRDFLKIVRFVKRGIFPKIGFKKNLYPAVYKSDAVQSILLAVRKGEIGQLYNISDINSHDLKVVANLIKKELKIKRIPIWLPETLTIIVLRVLHSFKIKFPISEKNIRFITAGREYSIEKACRILGYYPKVNLETGIRRTIRWYLKEGKI